MKLVTKHMWELTVGEKQGHKCRSCLEVSSKCNTPEPKRWAKYFYEHPKYPERTGYYCKQCYPFSL